VSLLNFLPSYPRQSDSLKASNLFRFSFRTMAGRVSRTVPRQPRKHAVLFFRQKNPPSSTFRGASKRRLFPRHEKEMMALRSRSSKVMRVVEARPQLEREKKKKNCRVVSE